jgi:hypothetical protein
MACSPTKTCAVNFFFNHPFNVKCIPAKKQIHPSFAAIATLYVKDWVAITLLQSTVLYVNINNIK